MGELRDDSEPVAERRSTGREPAAPPPMSDVEGAELDKRSSIGRNLFHMATSQVLTWALTTMLLVTQPRYLGPETLGELRLAISLWAIAQVFVGLGTGQYQTLVTARDRRAGIALVGPVMVLRTIAFVASSVVLGGYVIVVGGTSDFVAIMLLSGLSTLFAALSQALGATFVGLERMSVLAISTVVYRLVGTGLAVGILLAGGDVVSMVTALVFAQLLGFGVLFQQYRKLGRFEFRGWQAAAAPILRGSLVFLVAAGALVVYQQVDTIIIALLVDNEDLGWYALADTLFGTLLFPVTIVMGSLFPVIGRLHAHDPDELVELMRRTLRMLLVITVPIGLGTVVVGPGVADLLFGADFRETGDVLVVLGPVIILTCVTVLFGRIAAGTDRQAFWTWLIVASTVLTVPLDLIFVPWTERVWSSGAIGGAMAYATTESIMVVVGLWKIAPYLLERSMLDRVVRVGMAGGIMMAVTWPFRDRFVGLPILVGAVTYVLAALVLGVVNKDERALLGRALRRGPRR